MIFFNLYNCLMHKNYTKKKDHHKDGLKTDYERTAMREK